MPALAVKTETRDSLMLNAYGKIKQNKPSNRMKKGKKLDGT